MEKISKSRIILICGMTLLTSCASDGPERPSGPEEGDRTPLEVIADVGGGTRATATAFEAGDSIGITVFERYNDSDAKSAIDATDEMYRYRNVLYTKAEDDENGAGVFRADKSGGLFFENTAKYSFTAYYPFCGNPGQDNKLQIDTYVSQNDNARKKLDIMYAKSDFSKSESEQNPPKKLSFTGTSSFRHLMSKVVFRVYLDKKSFLDYVDDAGNKVLDLDTYLANSQTHVTGLVHKAEFDTGTGVLTPAVAPDAAPRDDWNLTTAKALRKLHIITTDENGNALAEADQYEALDYEVIVIPQKSDNVVTMSLVNVDGTAFTSQPFKIDFKAGYTYVVKMKVCRTGVTIFFEERVIEDWKAGDDISVDTPTGDKD